MKLGEVRKAAWAQLYSLMQRKKALQTMLENEAAGGTVPPQFDRVEVSKELSAIEDAYKETQAVADHLNQMDAAIQNAEIARQQGEVISEAAEDFIKILEVYRRISKGDKVPPADEKRLMDYSYEMYAAAKNMAMMVENKERKEHDSLWEDEEVPEEPTDPAELAANTEVGNPLAAVEVPSTDAPETGQ